MSRTRMSMIDVSATQPRLAGLGPPPAGLVGDKLHCFHVATLFDGHLVTRCGCTGDAFANDDVTSPEAAIYKTFVLNLLVKNKNNNNNNNNK